MLWTEIMYNKECHREEKLASCSPMDDKMIKVLNFPFKNNITYEQIH